MTSKLEPRVQALIDTGETWRAREWLSGRIGSQDYDPELYALYGKVLYRLEDKYQAGKYLFLGGCDEPPYDSAVRLFLERQKNQDVYGFFSLMPRKFVQAPSSRYLASVLAYIDSRGFRKKSIEGMKRPAPETLTITEKLVFASLAIFLVTAVIVGSWVIVRTMIRWIF